jgi:hypothetical protein
MAQKRKVMAVRSLLSDSRIDPTYNENVAIRKMCMDSTKASTEIFQLLFQHPKVQNDREKWIAQALHSACGAQNLSIVKQLLLYPHPSIASSEILSAAIESGNPKCVRLLLRTKLFDPTIEDNLPVKEAAKYGYQAVLKLLLRQPNVDPSNALPAGPSFKVLKILLQYPNVDPTRKNNEVLKNMCSREDIRALKLLLKHPRIDPSFENNKLLEFATSNKKMEAVKLLLMDPRVGITDNVLQGCLRIGVTATISKSAPILSMLLDDNRCNSTMDYSRLLELAARHKVNEACLTLLKQHPKVLKACNYQMEIKN